MACLDTTFLIDLGRRSGARQKRAREKLREVAARGERLSTTRFNVAELHVGIFRADDAERERKAVEAVLSGLAILDFDQDSAAVFGHITAHLQRLGRPAGDMDALIAATALVAAETIITRNPGHFDEIPGLAVEAY